MKVLFKTTMLLLIPFLFSRPGTGLPSQKPILTYHEPTEVLMKERMGTNQILVFTKTNGYRHRSIEKGVTVLKELGKEHDFQITNTEDSLAFNIRNLSKFDLVIFLSTTMDVLGEAQEQAFKTYINNGGSYMGIHAAADTEYEWPWYGKLVGAYFESHPKQQEAKINVVEKTHPSTSHLNDTWLHFDEWYNYKNINPDIKVLMTLDESSYKGGKNGDYHPIAWCSEFDGGRAFYTGLGHTVESYDDPDFRKHLVGGILYCLDKTN